MRTILILTGIMLSAMINAQQSNLDEIFKSFEGKKGITTIHMSSDLMKMASEIDTKDSDLNSAIGMISEVKVIALNNATSEEKVSFKNLLKSLPLNDYKILMTIKEDNQDIKLLSKGSNSRVSEFLMIINSDKSPALISITGDIELAKLSKLSDKVHIDGFKHLAKLNHKKS